MNFSPRNRLFVALLGAACHNDSLVAEPRGLHESGWRLSGGGRDVYQVVADPEAARDGHATIRLEAIPEREEYGTWMRSIDASPYRGKRVRLSALTKSSGAAVRVDFWARVQASDSPGDGSGLGGRLRRLSPDQDWERKEVVLNVPEAGAYIQYGVGLAGPGRIWMDDAKIEIVGLDVPVSK